MQVDQQNETENNHSQNEHNTHQVNAIFKKKRHEWIICGHVYQ